MTPLIVLLTVTVFMIMVFEASRFLPWSGTITSNVLVAVPMIWDVFTTTGGAGLINTGYATAFASAMALSNMYMRWRKAPVVRSADKGVR